MQKMFYPLVFACLIVTGCVSNQQDPMADPQATGMTAPPTPGMATPQAPGMANPASTYCAQQGGRSIPVQSARGQRADCQLPDGRRVDEWKLYRSANRQSQATLPQ
ncbi:DUF333 domain-containing protein [Labrys sp. WJW]|jgi:hypothetical protein|uniref:putative hemolysin n=1 Tax=Labrys sp. WJW TaxID=1737983 RepID=UPI00273A163E|nr:DUF333 domain-containing protein [Labrys sp. WJW]